MTDPKNAPQKKVLFRGLHTAGGKIRKWCSVLTKHVNTTRKDTSNPFVIHIFPH